MTPVTHALGKDGEAGGNSCDSCDKVTPVTFEMGSVLELGRWGKLGEVGQK